jgi:periplasmic copper chaperone A
MRSRTSRGLVQRAAAVAAGSLIAVVALAGPAFAHVVITPSSAPAGSAAELTFRVPDEEAKAATVELQVKIPTDHPIAQLLVKPVPGWTASVTTVTLAKPITTDDGTFDSAVSEVTWTGGKILAGQFQDFSVSADPLPSGISQLVFKAVQTYSNGDVVRWIDLAQPGEPAPEHPAPTLALTAGDTGTTGGTAAGPMDMSGTSGSGDGDVTVAILLGAGGFAIGLVGLVAGLSAWQTSRRASRP